MSIQLIVLIAFALTGIGLLLFRLNQKNQRINDEQNIQYNVSQPYAKDYHKEKFILTLVINAERDRDLINSLQNSTSLELEDSRKLYDATKYLWMDSENKFKRSAINQEFTNNYLVDISSEYDVYFVKIELDKFDPRFEPEINQMDRRDAFRNLANQSPKVTVSQRLSSKAYENTEFYSR